MLNRRSLLTSGLFASVLALTATSGPVFAQAPRELRIGYQKNGILLIAKQQGVLEKAFAPQGITIKWVEFSFGPPLLEALNTGNIDYGTTGDAPPIFAQAASANLLYVAAQEAAGSGSAILVPAGSTIQSVAELKGKRIGFAKASSAHNLTIAALDQAGLTYKDITPVYLAPADAAAAFARGSIDAWTIWDPFFAIAENQKGTRILALAKGIAAQNSYFLANKAFTAKNPALVSAINGELAKVAQWAAANRGEVAKVLAEATGIDLEWQKKAVERTDFAITPLNDRIVAEQQHIADRFHRLELIPSPIRVKDIVWTWNPAS